MTINPEALSPMRAQAIPSPTRPEAALFAELTPTAAWSRRVRRIGGLIQAAFAAFWLVRASLSIGGRAEDALIAGSESRISSPPIAVQNLMLPPLWALAKLFGVRPYYDRWDSRT